MKNIEELLSYPPISLEGRNKKVLNYSVESESFNFYNDQFNGENSFEIGSAIKKENLNDAPPEMQEIITYLKGNIPLDSVLIELGGSKHQRRSGFPYFIFPNYFPLDISQSSMVNYSELYDRPSISCDAQNLPLKDNSVDAVFTHTFLEHPINPDKVVKEIDRVLKSGGIVLHADAWHCRWWKRYGIYKVKKWKDISFKEKMLYIIILFSELKLLRFPLIVIKRFFKELLISKRKSNDLIFKKLIPNYELKIYSDEDAAASIDPVDLIRFYESRGYKMEQNKTFLERLFFNDMYIALKKK